MSGGLPFHLITFKRRRSGFPARHQITEIAYEGELSRSVIYYIQQSKKDPQLTTFWRLAEGFGIKPSELLKLLEDKMPPDWAILEE